MQEGNSLTNTSLAKTIEGLSDWLLAASARCYKQLAQCVPIRMQEGGSGMSRSLADVKEVQGLGDWLQSAFMRRHDHTVAGERTCIMLTAPPAAGKTRLMSQLVVHTLASAGAPLVPIMVKVQRLQQLMLSDEHRDAFAHAWNWVDTYLQCL
eukprot:4279332-Prymnesium_polylepis.1